MTIDTKRLRRIGHAVGLECGHNAGEMIKSAADAIEAQRAEIDRYRRAAGRWKKVAESAEGRVRDQAAEIERLRAALEDMLDMYGGSIDCECRPKDDYEMYRITAARAALAQKQGD